MIANAWVHGRRMGAAPSLLLVLAWISAAPDFVHAHPFHVTIAEAEHNVSAKTLEVALRVNSVDLEAILSKRTNRKVDLDETKDVDAMIVSYLNEAFRIETAAKAPVKLKWVGKETEVKTAWLYFEFPVADGIDGLRVSDRVFFELEPDQTNTINLKRGKDRASLRFTRQTPALNLAFPKSGSVPAKPGP